MRYTHSNCWTEEWMSFLSKPEEGACCTKASGQTARPIWWSIARASVCNGQTPTSTARGKDLSIHLLYRNRMFVGWPWMLLPD
ncbi:MAG: hypothetical protein IPJ54_18370 [Saprospiraceae bacterium]|nr:hypothetical protein [Saprospiraceae bacterium]